jgi:hypothetical protein
MSDKFNKPPYVGDDDVFTDWGRRSKWYLEEALLLSVGLNPDGFDRQEFFEFIFTPPQKDVSCVYKTFQKITSLVSREFGFSLGHGADHGYVGWGKRGDFKPKEFLEWLEAKGIAYPAKLNQSVHLYGKTVDEIRNHKPPENEASVAKNKSQANLPKKITTEDKPINERKRNADLRLIAALACVILERHIDKKDLHPFKTQDALINAVIDKYKGDGLSKSSIENKILEGRGLLDNCEK